MAPFSAIPAELVLAILEEAQYDDILPRYKWLKRYSRVCRTWRPYAQRLLFTQVALLRGAPHCQAFVTAVSPTPTSDEAHLAFLRGSVRSLAMVVDHQEIYAEVVELCPNVTELHVSLFHASFRPEVLARFARGPQIEVLRIRAYHQWTLAQLLSVYVTVKYLEVDMNSGRETALDTDGWPAPPGQLRELRYSNVYHRTHPFFRWILSGSSKDTLEVLELRSPNIRTDTLAELSVGARLRSLLLPVVSLQQGAELASVAPKLEELELLMVMPFPQSVFDGLPPGLVHLGLRDASGDAGLAAHVHALATYHDRSGGTLRVLSHHRRCEDADEEGGGESRDTFALFQFCQSKGIEFRSFEPMYGHYAGERVPLGPARTFPRPAPLSERRAVTVDENGFKMGGKVKRSFVRRVAKAAGKAFGSSIPPVALAKP
ncbi:hypothetical protein C8Q77DRAFT_857572 [Trametes polyzona]|nr:hypothetical protein C8Q77DRAFT_857572 [Trametes polyzona]